MKSSTKIAPDEAEAAPFQHEFRRETALVDIDPAEPCGLCVDLNPGDERQNSKTSRFTRQMHLTAEILSRMSNSSLWFHDCASQYRPKSACNL